MPEELDAEYRHLIDRQLTKRNGTAIPCATPLTARVLIEEMFRNAKRAVRVMAGEFNPQVYGSPLAISFATQFLADPEHSLQIVFEGEVSDAAVSDHPLVRGIGQAPNFQVFAVDRKLAAKIKCHFSVMDGDSYRFEGDKNGHAAVAVFGDNVFAEGLIEYFEAVVKRARRINVKIFDRAYA